MAHFSKQEIEEIRQRISVLSKKDSDFEEVENLDGEVYFPILKDEDNKRIGFDALLEELKEKGDFSSAGIVDAPELEALIVSIDEDQYLVKRDKIEVPKAPNVTASQMFIGSGTVTFSSPVSGATIRYTMEDDVEPEDPTPTKGNIGTTLTISQNNNLILRTVYVKAIATKFGLGSEVVSRVYTVRRKIANVSISATGNNYSVTRTVSISCSTPGVAIHYTTNGSNPTSSSPVYDASNKPVLNATTTVKAIAILADWENSNIASSSITVGTPAMHYGFAGETIDVAGVEALAGYKETTSPAGEYTSTTSVDAYLWICINPTQTINKVTSSGFDVPMRAAVTVGKYKCYRSVEEISAGSMTYIIV